MKTCYDCRYIVFDEETPEDGKCPSCREPLKEMPEDREIWVNLYLENRAYGGPQEGGWWFDYGTVEGSIPVQVRDAKTMMEIMARFVQDGNESRNSDVGSVVSEGRYKVCLEFSKGEPWPKEKPVYC